MYIIKSSYNGKEIYFISKEYNQRFSLPLIKFSTSIDKATKYDNLDIAISDCKNLLNCNFNIYPICPACGNDYSGHSALSRKDNKTEICPDCGIAEAMNIFINAQN